MANHITLEDITIDNFEALMDMELPEHQHDLLASNAYSIAQAKFYPDYIPRAIYRDGAPADFLLYDRCSNDRPGEYGIYRFMVDYPLQSQGIGRRAMELVLDEIRANQDAVRITICYHTRNERAKAFYAGFGFREVGTDDSGEMVAEIRLA